MGKALNIEELPSKHPLRKIYAFKKKDESDAAFLARAGIKSWEKNRWAKDKENPRIPVPKLQDIAAQLRVPDQYKKWFFFDEGPNPMDPSVKRKVGTLEEEIMGLVAYALPPEPFDDRSEDAARYEEYAGKVYDKAHKIVTYFQDWIDDMQSQLEEYVSREKEFETRLADRDMHIVALHAENDELKAQNTKAPTLTRGIVARRKGGAAVVRRKKKGEESPGYQVEKE